MSCSRRWITPKSPRNASRKLVPYFCVFSSGSVARYYRRRIEVERLFNRLKQFRRVVTRYDKLDETILAFVHLTAALVMIR